MIRIVGVQRASNPQKEFILLQNQGSLRLTLRGHLVASDQAIRNSDLAIGAHAFSDDVAIGPGMYVLLHTGVRRCAEARTSRAQSRRRRKTRGRR